MIWFSVLAYLAVLLPKLGTTNSAPFNGDDSEDICL